MIGPRLANLSLKLKEAGLKDVDVEWSDNGQVTLHNRAAAEAITLDYNVALVSAGATAVEAYRKGFIASLLWDAWKAFKRNAEI